MGNNQSRPSGSASGSGTGNTPSQTKGQSFAGSNAHPSSRREPRRRESIQALSSGKASAAPPSESLASAIAHPSSKSTHPSQHHQQQQPPPSHARRRSKTIDSYAIPASPPPVNEMGQEQSKAQHERLSKEKPYSYKERPTQPVDVPTPVEGVAIPHPQAIDPSGPPAVLHHIPSSQTQRPPRLPLPIEEEVHLPGSPIIKPSDIAVDLETDSLDGGLPRKSSGLSSTTLGEDEEEDVHPAIVPPATSGKTVPTPVEWRRGGNKVYVTGTFARWEKKIRLQKHPTKPDTLTATLQLPPGTHHLKFIVDGDMRTSDDLPTAVDFTNILVNYIEVSLEDVPTSPTKPRDIKHRPIPRDLHPPRVLPDTPDSKPGSMHESDGREKASQPAPELIPSRDYATKIPRYLLEFDMAEDSSQYQRAAAEIGHVPEPPSLPQILSKSILNGSSLMKDDASVLTMPNHTMLNHLATSNIKAGVLATSATTRYKRKYVSTILYKPTNGDD